MNLEEAKKDAQRANRGVRLLEEYLGREIVPLINGLASIPRKTESVVGLFYRALLLLQGLCRLDHASDFQLALAANRALMEILVDSVLLHHEEPQDALLRLEQWERSARLKASEGTLAYVTSKRGGLTDLEKPLLDFVERSKDDIELARKDLWPDPRKPARGRHANRWTGMSLLDDVREADRLHGTRLEDFYEKEYRRMNLNVHGSGLAGVRGLDYKTLAVWYGLAQRKCGEFMIEITEILLRNLDCDREAQLGRLGEATARWGATVAPDY